MATHKSAQKRIRQNTRRRLRNRMVRGSVRTMVKAAREAVERGDANAKELVVAAERALAKAVSKGILHKANAARRVSRLASKVGKKSKASK